MVQTLDKKDSGKDKRRLVSNRTERHASVIFSLPLSRGECAILKSGRAASLIKFEIQVWRGIEAGGTTGRVGKFGEFTPRLFPIAIILLKLIKYIYNPCDRKEEKKGIFTQKLRDACKMLKIDNCDWNLPPEENRISAKLLLGLYASRFFTLITHALHFFFVLLFHR